MEKKQAGGLGKLTDPDLARPRHALTSWISLSIYPSRQHCLCSSLEDLYDVGLYNNDIYVVGLRSRQRMGETFKDCHGFFVMNMTLVTNLPGIS